MISSHFCEEKIQSDEIEKCWLTINDPPLIAGPWVPLGPYRNAPCGVYRYNHIGQPLAMALSQEEVVSEDVRLEKLGYFLTDKDRQIPASWWSDCLISEEE